MRSKYEIKAQKELERTGWRVDNKAGMGRFAKNRDFWNLFDLVAIKKGYSCVRWISIKGHAGAPRTHQDAILRFPLPQGNIKELWVHGKRKWSKRKTVFPSKGRYLWTTSL